MLKYTWLGDGITHSEGGVLYALRAFAERGGVEATKQVMDYQWLADGVTWDEHDLIAELESSSQTTQRRQYRSVAVRLSSTCWD